MKELYESCARLLSGGEDVVTATIIQQDGSSPRTAGTKMLIRRDGSFQGTIGGGFLEGRVLQLAREVYASGRSLCEKFIFTPDNVSTMDMICGGEVDVFIDLVPSTSPEYLEIYRFLTELENYRQRVLLVSKIITGDESKNGLKQCLLLEDKMIGMEMSGEQREQLLQLKYGRSPLLLTMDGTKYLVELLSSPTTVYIFGAGHVSQKIARLTCLIGFRTIVLDDREEFASRQRFPWADEIIVLNNFNQCFRDLPVDRSSYLIIVTRGHKSDMVVLAQALETEACYIGMIGSRKKRDAIYKALCEAGFREDQLARVYSPIGLPINAETPEEIAVSIVAELIQVRAGQNNI